MKTAFIATVLVAVSSFGALAYDEPSWPEVAAGNGPARDRYVSTVVSAAEYANGGQMKAGLAPIFCAPAGGVSAVMAMDASTTWVARNPAFRLFPAPHVIYAALHEAYPCPTS